MLYISLRQYEYICAISRHGSLSAAAHSVNVSQPALSNAVTRVEGFLGYPLFVRKRGASMSPTPQGRSFIEQAESLLADAGRLENAERAAPGKTRLRLGCFNDLAPFLLARALHRLRQDLPDVTVTYHVDDFEGLIGRLISGQTDLALTYGLTLDDGFSQTTLFTRSPVAVISPTHPLARQKTALLAEVAQYPLILSDEGLSAQHFLGLFKRIGLRPRIAHRAASPELQRSLAANDEGVAISYADIPARVSYDGLPLVHVPICDPIAAEPVALARHGKGPMDPQTEKAAHLLAEIMT